MVKFKDGYEMLYKVSRNIEEVCHWLSKSSVQFQGHTAQKIANFILISVFPDDKSTFNLQMAMKRCAKLQGV